MTHATRLDTFHRLYRRRFHVVLFALVLSLCGAAQVSAQPTHLQGPSLGTSIMGVVELQLRASGGGTPGVYTWSLISGALPLGVSLRTDVPAFFPFDADAGLIGVATTPGNYSFTLRVESGGQTADRAYTWKITALSINNQALQDGFVEKPYSHQFEVLNAQGPVTFAPTSLPAVGGWSLTSGGLLTGTPAGGGFLNVSFTISDTVDMTGHGRTIPVFIIDIPTDGSLPNATQFASYNAMIEATGGSGNYTFAACPGNTVGTNCVPGQLALPAGLTLDLSGAISGTVTAGAGRYGFTVTATDSNQVSYSKLMAIHVVGVPPTLPSLFLYGGRLDDCTIGTGCSNGIAVIAGAGGPYTWSANGLPPGMSIRTGSRVTQQYVTPGDAELWGTPSQSGDFDVKVTATDTEGNSVTNTFPLHVSTMQLRDRLVSGTINTPYSSKLRVVGGQVNASDPLYAAVQIAGRLPTGLAFNPAMLSVSGTPLENNQFVNSFDPLFQFTDGSGDSLTLHSYFNISGDASTIGINTGNNLGTRLPGSFTQITFTACCVPSITWSQVDGTLPPGMTLSSSGLLSGTPTMEGRFDFLVQAADATNPANAGVRSFTLTITSLTVTSAVFPQFANVGDDFTFALTPSGGSGPYTFGFTPFTYPAPGLEIDASTGELFGMFMESGRYSLSVDLRDSAGAVVTRGFSISVYPEGENPPLNLNIGPTFGPRLRGILNIQLTTTGGVPPYSYSMTPGAPDIPGMRVQDGQPLPTNFTVPAGYIGVLTDSGIFTTSLRVTDSTNATFDRAITIIVSPLNHLSQTTLPRATVGEPYSTQLTGVGGGGLYSWSLSNSALPTGLTLSSSGQISGTPTIAGNIGFTVLLTDLTTADFVTVTYSIPVNPYAIATGGVLPRGVVGTPYNQMLEAPGCGNGCTWTPLAVGGGVSLGADGVLSGTPTGTFNGSFLATVIGSNGTAQTRFSLQILANTPQPLIISTATFGPSVAGDGVANAPFAAGGTPPYSWSLESGVLPTGLELQGPGELLGANLNPGFAYLAGRVSELGVFSFTLRVTDSLGATSTRDFTWNISALSFQYTALPVTGPLLNNPLIYNSAYEQAILVIGGTGNYTFSRINNAAMPPGLALSDEGVVSGTPTNTGTVSTAIQVVDDAGNFNTRSISFNIAAGTPVTLGFSSGPNLGTIQQGFQRTFNVTPTGGTPPYIVTELTPLPAGFVLQSGDSAFAGAASFVVTGTPLTTGPLSFTLQAVDSLGNIGVRTFNLTVTSFTRFSSATLGDGSVGVLYSQPIVTWQPGGPVIWTVTFGSALPPGLNLSAAGEISGTPLTAGNYGFTLTATDMSGVALNFGFTLRISQISIADPLLIPQIAILGQPFTYTFTGGGPNGVWSATGLPAGLTMSPTGEISGTPTAAGTFTLLVTVTDGIVPITRRFTLFSRLRNPTVISSNIAPLDDVTVGQSASFTLLAGGGLPPYEWRAIGTLPPGMQLIVPGANLPNLQPGSTILAGAPTTAGVYVFELELEDSAGVTTRRTFTLNVTPVNIPSGTLRTAITGLAYAHQFTATGGTGPYTFTMTAVNFQQDMLPPGLAMTPGGLISGTATSTGNYIFRVKATDAMGKTFERTVTLTVNSPSGLRITNINPATAFVGRGRQMTLTTSGAATYSWEKVAGLFPPGVGLLPSGANTLLSGAASAAGIYAFTLRATEVGNPAVFADHTFAYRVVPTQVNSPFAGTGVFFDLPSGQVGEPYSFSIKVVGGTPPYSFAESPFNPLPKGLSLSASGVLSGIPEQSGSYALAPLVSDNAGNTDNNVFMTLVITPASAVPPLIQINSTALPGGSVGVPYIGALVEINRLLRGGTAPFTWTVANGSELPPGMLLLAGGNGISNLLGGVPTAAGTFGFALVVTDSGGQSLTIPFTLTISNVAITPGALSPGKVGTFYSQPLVASGGAGPYIIAAAANSDMPPGLSLGSNGVLEGTPTAPGNFRLFLNVTAANAETLSSTYLMTVDNATGQAPALNLAPDSVQVLYQTGSPAPAPVPINVGTSSGNLPFNAIVTGIPGATLSAAGGMTSSVVNLNVPALAVGTYRGVVASTASDSANRFDAVPVTVTSIAPPPCSYAAILSTSSVQASGGSGSFDVSTAPGCAWATTGPPLTVVQITGGSGNGLKTVSYNVIGANLGANPRILTINVRAGSVLGPIVATHSITQFGQACSFAISPGRLPAPAAGGSASITITPSESCTESDSWTVENLSPGLTADRAFGTINDRSLTVTAAPNGDVAARSLTGTIGLRTLTVDQSGAACTVGLSPYEASISAGGGPGSIAVTIPQGCSYETTSVPNWITITSGGSGTASGDLLYNVTPNSTTEPRLGTLAIGGQSFQMTQAALACSVTIDTASLGNPYAAAGGAGLIKIIANGANCSWSASSNASWASVSPLSGTGNGTVGVTVLSNASSTTERPAALTVASQTVNISQFGTACTFSLQSQNGSVPASGGSGSVGVVAPTVCGWQSSSNDSWIAITSSGTAGAGEVKFTALPNNSSDPRDGSLTIAGLSYTMSQSGAPCAYALVPGNVNVAADGADGSFAFSTAAADCVPSALSYAGWIKNVTTSFNGAAGAVDFTVDPNPSTATRTGTIRLGEQNFTVTQTGGVCGFSLNAYSAGFGPAGDDLASLLGSPSAVGCEPVVGTDQRFFIDLGDLSGPVGNIFTLNFSISPYSSITPAIRFGKITFGGQILSIKQTSY